MTDSSNRRFRRPAGRGDQWYATFADGKEPGLFLATLFKAYVALERFRWSEPDLKARRKGDPRKVELVWELRSKTTLPPLPANPCWEYDNLINCPLSSQGPEPKELCALFCILWLRKWGWVC